MLQVKEGLAKTNEMWILRERNNSRDGAADVRMHSIAVALRGWIVW